MTEPVPEPTGPGREQEGGRAKPAGGQAGGTSRWLEARSGDLLQGDVASEEGGERARGSPSCPTGEGAG